MPGDSHFWAGLMKVKDEFLSMGRFDLGDGSQVQFWEDSWISLVAPGFPKKTKHSLYVCPGSPHIQQQNRNIKTMFI
jgi:hypothetical protein